MRGRKPELKPSDGGLSKLPPAPAWLSAEAKAEWRRVSPGLGARRTLTRQDLPVLEAYCLAVGTVRRSQATITAEGDFIVTARGERRRHPAFQTLFQGMTESRRLAAELGLTPASRNKASSTEGENDLSDLDL